jgi:hypothetical protein
VTTRLLRSESTTALAVVVAKQLAINVVLRIDNRMGSTMFTGEMMGKSS